MGQRIVRMSRELFETFFVAGNRWPDDENRRLRVVEGLPPGARLNAVSMELLFHSDEIALRFESPEWPDAAPGAAIPFAPVTYALEQTTEFRRWHLESLDDGERRQLVAELLASLPAAPSPRLSDAARMLADAVRAGEAEAVWPLVDEILEHRERT